MPIIITITFILRPINHFASLFIIEILKGFGILLNSTELYQKCGEQAGDNL